MDGAAPSPILPIARRLFTGRDIERMVEIGPDERVELIHGDIIDMGKEGRVHWRARQRLISWLLRRLQPDIDLAPDGPLRLAKHEEPEPDFYLFPSSMDVNDVGGRDVFLAVEIADSSLAKDRNVKAPLYGSHGVQEYWIIGLEARETHIYRLADGVYADPEAVSFDAPLSVPGIDEPLIIRNVLS
jgi:Uma2 family endonuclease